MLSERCAHGRSFEEARSRTCPERSLLLALLPESAAHLHSIPRELPNVVKKRPGEPRSMPVLSSFPHFGPVSWAGRESNPEFLSEGRF